MAKLNIPGYQIKAHVGSGGMAVVFRALQESLQRPVALKVLKNTESREWTERFLNEGRILASLSHRNIITVHDIGIHAGHIYISMEYVNGGDLKSRIEAGMTAKEALEILTTIGEALEIAHKKGVIHRILPGATRKPTSTRAGCRGRRLGANMSFHVVERGKLLERPSASIA